MVEWRGKQRERSKRQFFYETSHQLPRQKCFKDCKTEGEEPPRGDGDSRVETPRDAKPEVALGSHPGETTMVIITIETEIMTTMTFMMLKAEIMTTMIIMMVMTKMVMTTSCQERVSAEIKLYVSNSPEDKKKSLREKLLKAIMNIK